MLFVLRKLGLMKTHVLVKYNLYRKDRVNFRHGGGVCIYIKNCYKTYEVLESDLGFTDTSIETVWCGCIINNEKLLVGCIYRPKDASEEANRQINKALLKASSLVRKVEFT